MKPKRSPADPRLYGKTKGPKPTMFAELPPCRFRDESKLHDEDIPGPCCGAILPIEVNTCQLDGIKCTVAGVAIDGSATAKCRGCDRGDV